MAAPWLVRFGWDVAPCCATSLSMGLTGTKKIYKVKVQVSKDPLHIHSHAVASCHILRWFELFHLFGAFTIMIEAFGSMCGHLLNGVWSAWSVSDSAPPPSSVYASLPQSRSQLRFLQVCISGLLTVIFCQEDEPHTPGASTGASTVQGAEIVVKGNFDTSLPGSTVAVPPLWSTNDGSLAEIGRPWQHFDSGESIVIRCN